MEVVHEICCGADVHKKTVVATIAEGPEGAAAKYTRRSFSTLSSGLRDFRDWLLGRGCMDVCMESTGVYWVPVYRALEQAGVRVCLTHPKRVRAIKGKKTDAKDSKWIADLFRHDLVRSSFVPPPDFRALRQVSRYRFKLVAMRTSERNRYQNGMTISSVGLASVLSNPFGKSAQAVMGRLLETGAPPDEDECRELSFGTAKRKAAEMADSLADASVPADQAFKLVEARDHARYLDEAIARAEGKLRELLEPYWGAVGLLESMPGVTEASAMLILAETGVDMSVFEDAGHFCSWAGLAPGCNESADKRKSSRITRAGTYLKPLLVQCALGAVRNADDGYFAAKYARIKGRRGHKKAIIAVARMMLSCIYHMLSSGEYFNPRDRGRDPQPRRDARPDGGADAERPALTVDAAMGFLASCGYDISSLAKTAPPPV